MLLDLFKAKKVVLSIWKNVYSEYKNELYLNCPHLRHRWSAWGRQIQYILLRIGGVCTD
jgi:hypothetical protein